ncbi:MAG: hypothetical protein NVS9B4_23580 [Candidatus Acidiferrum sp.]
MFGATLLSISTVAVSQFALYYWRAVMASVALRPVSDCVLTAANVENGRLTGCHFPRLASLHALTPDLHQGQGGLRFVELYFNAVRAVDNMLGSLLPKVTVWSQREQTLCARYAAVCVDRRLQDNMALSASMRSC